MWFSGLGSPWFGPWFQIGETGVYVHFAGHGVVQALVAGRAQLLVAIPGTGAFAADISVGDYGFEPGAGETITVTLREVSSGSERTIIIMRADTSERVSVSGDIDDLGATERNNISVTLNREDVATSSRANIAASKRSRVTLSPLSRPAASLRPDAPASSRTTISSSQDKAIEALERLGIGVSVDPKIEVD